MRERERGEKKVMISVQPDEATERDLTIVPGTSCTIKLIAWALHTILQSALDVR